jgi:hypothetical protein
MDDLSIELRCFRIGHKIKDGGLGAAGHFKRAATIQWGPDNRRKEFIWHPWADKMLEEACRWQYLSVSGPGNIGKSDFFAIWALINWQCDPMNTMVIVTSTTMTASRKRIWGSIVDYFGAMAHKPGKLVDSMGIIRTLSTDGRKVSDKAGISLVAGEASKDRESADKLDGCHNKRVIMVGDEFPKLSMALLKFATGNLSKNPWFQFIGIGNPTSKYDPHGIISEPKAGWNSISEADYEWETKLGYAIRFDSYESPNIKAGSILFPFLPTVETVAQSEADNGADSLAHWSQCRGFWPPEGTNSDSIYSEADLVDGSVNSTDVEWIGNPIPMSACDPARGAGGDDFRAVLALFGTTKGGGKKLMVTKTERFTESKSNPAPYLFQIADQYVAFCREHGVLPENVAYDTTGPAGAFGQVLASKFGNAVLHAVDFNGKPSEIPHGVNQKPCSELFADKVSELWIVGKDYMQSGQLKGLTNDIIQDMLDRRFSERQKVGQSGTKQAVESKRVMKKRIKRSPDSGDAFFVLLDMCRKKYKFRSEIGIIANKNAQAKWSSAQREADDEALNTVPTNLTIPRGLSDRVIPWDEPDEEAEYVQAFYRQ